MGHRHPRIVEAVTEQLGSLLHALGDVSPSGVKISLLEKLASLAPWPDAKVMLGLGGADAVDAAIKTAGLASGKPGLLAFEGGYHGLSAGPLAACGYKSAFRAPFAAQLNPTVRFAPWVGVDDDVASGLAEIERILDEAAPAIGAVLAEPIQGRGGVRFPGAGFLRGLRELCDRRGLVLIMDEIYTGMGRAGAMWSSVELGCTPDILCAGKALGGGLPISACIGRPSVMEAWGDPEGEALHTGTFLGNPIGCRAAIEALAILDEEDLVERSAHEGSVWLSALRSALGDHPRVRDIRGRGMMLAVEFEPEYPTLDLVRRLLEAGYLCLPCGAHAEALQLSPPVTTSSELRDLFIAALTRLVEST
jgi:4-aminobutyrate aminotransferase/(S)-3-amino-2-methylpropionate transaminase